MKRIFGLAGFAAAATSANVTPNRIPANNEK
jgi:hypothetical protein